MIEKSINFEIAQEESKDAVVNLVIEIRIGESNHVEESYIKVIQELNMSYRELVSYEDKKLINFEVALKIKQ